MIEFLKKSQAILIIWRFDQIKGESKWNSWVDHWWGKMLWRCRSRKLFWNILIDLKRILASCKIWRNRLNFRRCETQLEKDQPFNRRSYDPFWNIQTHYFKRWLLRFTFEYRRSISMRQWKEVTLRRTQSALINA